MKCLVVGGRGFVGRAISHELEGAGHSVLRVVGSASAVSDLVYREGLYSELRDLEEIELVVYAAGRVLPRHPVTLNQATDLDCRPFNELLEALERAKSGAKVLLLSSAGAVYGDSIGGGALDESGSLRPRSRYGLVRCYMEQALLQHTLSAPIRPFIFRLSNVYGPGQHPDGGSAFILRALRAARGEGRLSLWGGGTQTKDFLYIDDLVAAVRAVVSRTAPEPLRDPHFNICAGHSHSLLEVLETVEAVSGHSVPLERAEGLAADVPHVRLSAAKAANELGWRSTVDLRRGIQRFWEALKNELTGKAVA
jgi:UDP-glucose 4-epimerase